MVDKLLKNGNEESPGEGPQANCYYRPANSSTSSEVRSVEHTSTYTCDQAGDDEWKARNKGFSSDKTGRKHGQISLQVYRVFK